jgi:uncharacterized protein involved in outer membrane biogenesis
MRRLIRWALYFCILLVVLLVAAVLLLDTMAREMVVNRVRERTGMDARIGQIHVGLLSPTITLENVKLYNTADFGGSLFIDMPELHLEYDPSVFRSGAFHFKLVRLNLAEIALVQDKKGRLNIEDWGKKSRDAAGKKKSSGKDFKFTGIDTFILTLGKFRLSNLASGREQEIEFAIKDQITRNVTSETNLTSLNLLMAVHAGSLASSSNPVLDVSKLLKGLTSH